jgi:hypothetical protein
MKSLIACAVTLSCAFAGTGFGMAAMLSSGGVTSPTSAFAAPLAPSGAVATVAQLAPGPANPGGPYPFVAAPCQPSGCSS